ncbi:MAG: response regulator transcription factor [Chloroflexi bacterium]|nr:response regulator transcription factor [Chloroflexota bacterium]
MKKIRVVLADDHVVLRSGLKMLLNAQMDIEVVGEASDGAEAISKTADLNPDVLLLDITMPNIGGIDAMRIIKEKTPSVSILILTMHENESYLLKALRTGASGYILKKAADNELISAIKTVYGGEVFIPSSLTKSVVKEMVSGSVSQEETVDNDQEQLSQRELEVLTLVAQGYTNQQIANRLYLSVKTVETYKARVMGKLNLHSRVELVRYALHHGFLGKDNHTSQ